MSYGLLRTDCPIMLIFVQKCAAQKKVEPEKSYSHRKTNGFTSYFELYSIPRQDSYKRVGYLTRHVFLRSLISFML